MTARPEVVIHTDGSCLGNPGPGGWGAVLVNGSNRKELSGGFARTTNNRMEILAVIKALEALAKPCRVQLHTDSRYVKDAITAGWLRNWERNGWQTAAKKPVKNRDLWTQLSALLKGAGHEVNFHWVKGHAGDPENERCDELARTAAMGDGLAVDVGYG